MSSLNKLFRARIGFPGDETISFENLDTILEKTATSIPFENLAIINKRNKKITKQNLIEKILIKNEGGVCYEINTLLYYFLLENGLEVELVRARSYTVASRSWSQAGRTHILTLVTHQGEKYVIDTGFGINLSLTPIPLNGCVATSRNGDFRISRIESEDGDCYLELKLMHRDEDWVSGYIFDSNHVLKDETELNEVQQIIVDHPFSPFNKSPLVTLLTDSGNIVLTESTFTQRVDGKEYKEEIEGATFNRYLQQHFGLY
ncbi:arylamine N-acetyltransferase family protein [Bacillus sp. T3]|uniref:arylamine N-acetyltransferase family protein n=1 Tax=Bacillus sp. T3 TaxID=467262 RepID=UPI002980B9C9|nr:arylamine N-acetyltransferase [Bacillus sp. T3]